MSNPTSVLTISVEDGRTDRWVLLRIKDISV